MERKKLIRIAILFVIGIIILIVIENSIRGIGGLVEKNKLNKEQKEKEEKYQNSEEYKETLILEEIINDFVGILKDNNLDALYDLLDPNYKDYKYQNNKELFKEHIKKYVNEKSNISLLTYEKINGRFVCRLLSQDNQNIKSFITLITPKNDTYELIFDDITSIEKVEKSIQNTSKLKCNVLYNITAKQLSLYTLEFVNLGNKEMNYDIENIIVRDTFGNEFKAFVEDTKIHLNAGEKVRKDIVFTDSEIHKFSKTMLNIDIKDKNDNITTLKILLQSDI